MPVRMYWLVFETFVDDKNQQYPECAFITATVEGPANNLKLSMVDGNLIFQMFTKLSELSMPSKMCWVVLKLR